MPSRLDSGPRMATVQSAQGPLLVPYTIRRSSRARSIRLSLDYRNEAVLTVPNRVALRDALAFLQSQGDWLEASFKAAPRSPALKSYLVRHPHLSALGERVQVHLSFRPVKPTYAFDRGAGRVEFTFRSGDAAEKDLLLLLRKFAREVIPERAEFLASPHKLPFCRATVRDQSSRWGSFSSGGTLSLNWRLILLPTALHDYVIYHELAHARHMNHSRAFWEFLAGLDPRAKIHDRAIGGRWNHLMSLGRL